MVIEGNLHLWVPQADVLFMAGSSAIYEVAPYGKPIFVNDIDHVADHIFQVGAAINVSDVGCTMGVVQSVFKDKDTLELLKEGCNRLVEQCCYKLDGKATERFINVVQGLL